MNQKNAMTTLTGVLIILLVATTAAAAGEKVIVSKPVSATTQRERVSVNQALGESTHERAETESYFRSEGESARVEHRDASVRAVKIDIGDELGGAAGPGQERPRVEHEFHMKTAAKELDGEWKAVNKDFRLRKRARVAARGAFERSREASGGSSASVMPTSRTHKSARAQSDDGLQD